MSHATVNSPNTVVWQESGGILRGGIIILLDFFPSGACVTSEKLFCSPLTYHMDGGLFSSSSSLFSWLSSYPCQQCFPNVAWPSWKPSSHCLSSEAQRFSHQDKPVNGFRSKHVLVCIQGSTLNHLKHWMLHLRHRLADPS